LLAYHAALDRWREERAMKTGDHIRITKGGGSEHAIDVGDRTVIHFATGKGVRRSRLAALASDGARVEVVTHRERVFPRKQVVARAFSRFAESAYAAMFQDSEAFAIWCKSGKVPMRASAIPSAPEPGTPVHEALGPEAVAPSVPVKRKAKPVARVAAGRAAKKPAPKKPAPKKGAKVSAARAKVARSTKMSSPAKASRTKKASSPRRPSSPAKKVASTKASVSAKRTAKASARKPSRTARAAGKAPRPGQAQKRAVPARSAKQKRRKVARGRAVAGR
jgi:hypothetical protein